MSRLWIVVVSGMQTNLAIRQPNNRARTFSKIENGRRIFQASDELFMEVDTPNTIILIECKCGDVAIYQRRILVKVLPNPFVFASSVEASYTPNKKTQETFQLLALVWLVGCVLDTDKNRRRIRVGQHSRGRCIRPSSPGELFLAVVSPLM